MAAQRTLKIKQRKQRNPERLLSRDTKKGREARHGKKRRREGTRKNAAIRKRIGYEQASSGIGLDAKGV